MALFGVLNVWLPRIVEANNLGSTEKKPRKYITEEDLKNVDFNGTQVYGFFTEQPWNKFNNEPLYMEESPKQ